MSNIAFTVIYMVEAILLLTALGPRRYFNHRYFIEACLGACQETMIELFLENSFKIVLTEKAFSVKKASPQNCDKVLKTPLRYSFTLIPRSLSIAPKNSREPAFSDVFRGIERDQWYEVVYRDWKMLNDELVNFSLELVKSFQNYFPVHCFNATRALVQQITAFPTHPCAYENTIEIKQYLNVPNRSPEILIY